MREKRMSLSQASCLIRDGMLLAVGGNGMHRNPTLFCLELARKPVKELNALRCRARHRGGRTACDGAGGHGLLRFFRTGE